MIYKIRKCILILGIMLLMLLWTMNVSAADHDDGSDHQYKITLIKKASADKAGEREYVCTICGYTYTEEIPATGHIWSDWIVDIEPTATASGHAYRICTRYPDAVHIEEKEIPATGAIETTEAELAADGEDSQAASKTPSSDIKKEDIDKANDHQESSYAKSILEAPAANVMPENSGKEKVSILGGELNVGDVVFGTATVGIIWWYILLVWPLIAVLIWAKKKKKEVKDIHEEEEKIKNDKIDEIRKRDKDRQSDI